MTQGARLFADIINPENFVSRTGKDKPLRAEFSFRKHEIVFAFFIILTH